jgi:CubicO group peptidase (beta-lactamase class C family)
MYKRHLRRLILPLCAALPLISAQAAEVSPESQGFSTERLARIAPAMKAEIAIPGAVTLIARNGQIVHFEAHGFIDAAKTKPMTKDAVFRGFSMTKPFTSVAAMALIEQGKMSLRDPISNWMPEFKKMQVLTEVRDERGRTTRVAVPAKAEILVRDLLRHTSGFTYGGSAPFSRAEGGL